MLVKRMRCSVPGGMLHKLLLPTPMLSCDPGTLPRASEQQSGEAASVRASQCTVRGQCVHQQLEDGTGLRRRAS